MDIRGSRQRHRGEGRRVEQVIQSIIAFFVSLFGEFLSVVAAMPAEKGRIASGQMRLIPSSKADVDARAKAAGILSIAAVAVFLSGCGQTEIVLSTLYPIDDLPGGWPRLAQGEARVILADGTIGVVKDVGGLVLVHPSDLKTRLAIK